MHASHPTHLDGGGSIGTKSVDPPLLPLPPRALQDLRSSFLPPRPSSQRHSAVPGSTTTESCLTEIHAHTLSDLKGVLQVPRRSLSRNSSWVGTPQQRQVLWLPSKRWKPMSLTSLSCASTIDSSQAMPGIYGRGKAKHALHATVSRAVHESNTKVGSFEPMHNKSDSPSTLCMLRDCTSRDLPPRTWVCSCTQVRPGTEPEPDDVPIGASQRLQRSDMERHPHQIKI